MIKKIIQKIQTRNWTALLLDLLVVVIGILIAFQVDRAYESYQSRQAEQAYLLRLMADLDNDIKEYNVVIERTDKRLKQIDFLNKVISNPDAVREDITGFVRAMERITWRNFPIINGYTYNEMLSSGSMMLLRSEELRKKLSMYYASVEDTERLSFGENDQDQFRDETLGILDEDMLKFVENEDKYPLTVSADDALAMAVDFSGRTRAHLWLRRLAKYQVLMAERAESYTSQAQNLKDEIMGSLR